MERLETDIFKTKLTFLMTPERRLRELFTGLSIKVDNDRYPDMKFWFKDGKYICEYDIDRHFLTVNYILIWSIFECEFALEYDEVAIVIAETAGGILGLMQLFDGDVVYRDEYIGEAF